jgi:predicted nuclease of predicted toxin-antitoxin system
MRIKLDENLPVRLAAVLKGLDHDVHTITDENLSGASDPEVWDAAQRERRFLITQDLDFSGARRFAPGTHSGILLVRLHSPDRQSLVLRVTEIFRHEDVSGWEECFVVVTERKTRVIRPSC